MRVEARSLCFFVARSSLGRFASASVTNGSGAAHGLQVHTCIYVAQLITVHLAAKERAGDRCGTYTGIL